MKVNKVDWTCRADPLPMAGPVGEMYRPDASDFRPWCTRWEGYAIEDFRAEDHDGWDGDPREWRRLRPGVPEDEVKMAADRADNLEGLKHATLTQAQVICREPYERRVERIGAPGTPEERVTEVVRYRNEVSLDMLVPDVGKWFRRNRWHRKNLEGKRVLPESVARIMDAESETYQRTATGWALRVPRPDRREAMESDYERTLRRRRESQETTARWDSALDRALSAERRERDLRDMAEYHERSQPSLNPYRR